LRNRMRVLGMIWLLSAVGIFSGCPEKKQETEADTKTVATQPVAGHEKTQDKDLLPGGWEADIRDNLLGLVRKHGKDAPSYDPSKPPVVVFDFDNTCIRGDIGRAFFDFMVSERKIKFSEAVWEALPADKRGNIRSAWENLRKLPEAEQPTSPLLQEFRKLMHQAYWSLCHKMDGAKCYPWQVRFYAGYSPAELIRMAQEVMDREMKRRLGSEQIKSGPDDASPAITSTGIRVHSEIRDLMKLLRKEGFQVWIVSAGPHWVVTGAAKQFDVDPERIIGMRTKLVDGKLTTEMDPPPTFRQGKVEAIEKYIKAKPLLVLGDSWTDAEMLAYGTHAILIDRGYADLKEKATEAGWWIQPPFPVQ
jgi:phosphoserine phosphatase